LAFPDGSYTNGTRAHTHRELILEWLWEPKGSSLEYIWMLREGVDAATLVAALGAGPPQDEVTSSRVCTNQSSFHASGPPGLPTLLQYDCTAIGHCTTPHLTRLVYAIHHTILAMEISCKGQVRSCVAVWGWWAHACFTRGGGGGATTPPTRRGGGERAGRS